MQETNSKAAINERFLIITVGRSGSSLLSAVLADSGADFGLNTPTQWDPRRGEMEGRAIKLAAHNYRRAYDISLGRKYLFSPAIETKLRLSRAKKYLKIALQDSRYLKIGDLDLVVQPTFKLGYKPTVILSYRQLELNLPSLLVGRTHVGPDQLAQEYVRIYRQGITLLKTFGGCTVAYNELQDPMSTAWSDALAATTQLDQATLVESRKTRLKGSIDSTDETVIYPHAYALFKQMQALSGVRVASSRQVSRSMGDA